MGFPKIQLFEPYSLEKILLKYFLFSYIINKSLLSSSKIYSIPLLKKDILECVNDEPELLAPTCKKGVRYTVCCNACRITDRNSYRQCQQNCYRRWCY